MHRFLSVFLIFISIVSANAQCVTNVDFNTWSVAGQPGNGNWQVQSGGSEVRQTVNGGNTYFVSPFDLMNVRVTGSFETSDRDDDWMGFVFSFLNPLTATNDYDCWLFDWKQEKQGSSPQGMSLCRIEGNIPPANYGRYFNDHINGPEFTVMQNDFGGRGWQRNYKHNFELRLTYTRAIIYVDGALVFDQAGCFKPGRFGFYNKSQKNCTYSNFQYDLFIDFLIDDDGRACLGDPVGFNFVNPCQVVSLNQYQSMTWDFGDGSPTVVNNNPTFANANVSHTYQNAGTYTATLTVTDANNCSSSATRNIEVAAPIQLNPTIVEPPCNGSLYGSITLAPTGGFGNFLYNWNGGVYNQYFWSGIGAGTYTVDVTDSICFTSATYTLDQPTALTATTSHTDASCGLSDGSVSISISGGTPPYQNINWAGVPGATRTGIPDGMYIADFEDANGCSALLQYRETVIELPCGINSSVAVTNVNCRGESTGSATLTVTGGASSPSITWTGGRTGATISNLPAGTYTYNYSDAVPANSFSGSITITEPGADMQADLLGIGISCPGSNDGQANASVLSGGNSPYSYNWSGGQANNPVANNLAPGAIAVTITDALGCTATANTTISGVPSLAVTTTSVMDSCYSAGKGRASASATGGTPPYKYEWSNFTTTANNPNLRAGTYTVTVSDRNGCTAVSTTSVTGPAAPLSSSYTKVDVLCYGDNTGEFDVTGSGGTAPYTFQWDSTSLSGNSHTGLYAGLYNYTITDDFGCYAIGGDTIFEPDSILSIQSLATDVSCAGADDGQITVTIAGGTAPYSYLGNNIPAGTTTIPNLPAGIYSGVLTDNNGCSIAHADTIIDASPLSNSMTIVMDSCFQSGNGSASASVSGGTPPYTYQWSNAVTTANNPNLVSGTYYLTITDDHACSLIDSAIVDGPQSAVSSTSTKVNVLCYGESTGSIDITASGGTPPYTYQWNPNTVSGNNPTGLSSGIYNYTITDNFACSITKADTIEEPASALSVQTVATDVQCNGANDGQISITIAGGTAPYSYLGNNVPAGTTVISNLSPGNYPGAITDANGCSVPVNETINEPGPQSISLSGTDNSCFGASQGTAIATVTNPTGTVSYDWTGGLSGQNISNLSAGTYTVTASDQNNCTFIDSIEITQPVPDTLVVVFTDATCFGANGTATANPSAGTPPFTYTWSNNATGQTVSLAAGNYTVTALDATGCGQFGLVSIAQPSEIQVSATVNDISCFGNTDGDISLNVSGGDDPAYTFVWSPNVSSNNSATNLAAGNYGVTVSDQSNCTKDTSFTIVEPAPIGLSATGTDLLCFEDASGTIKASVAGGVGPFNYSTTENRLDIVNSTTGDFSGLAAGDYFILVVDANGCVDSTTYSLDQAALLSASLNTKDISCYGDGNGLVNTSVSGGTAAYTYALSTGEQNNSGSFSNLEAGNYTLSVIDANGCESVETFDIVEPNEVVVSVDPDSTTVDAGNILELNASVNQNGDFIYYWEPDSGLSCYECPNPEFSSPFSATYVVRAVNENGCSDEERIYITVVPNYNMFVPTAFTPNGDGINDTWKIFGNIEGLKQMQVLLFNRWGEEVFQSRDPNFEWDGNFKGEQMNPDVYVWRVRLVFYDGYTTTVKGSLTLIR